MQQSTMYTAYSQTGQAYGLSTYGIDEHSLKNTAALTINIYIKQRNLFDTSRGELGGWYPQFTEALKQCKKKTKHVMVFKTFMYLLF